MFPTEASFRTPFFLSLAGLIALIFLTACQPLIRAQTGTQTKVPVVTPRNNMATLTPAEQNKTKPPASTALTAQDIAATPLHLDNRLTEQPVNKVDEREPEQPPVKTVPLLKSEKPAVKPTSNPADLVGRPHSYVSAQFGKPDFNRTEGVIHVLQYRQPDCVIDFFINIARITDTTIPADAKILGWAMRERTISQPLNQILCQQQFYERKL